MRRAHSPISVPSSRIARRVLYLSLSGKCPLTSWTTSVTSANTPNKGGGFYLLKSTDQGRSWSDPFYVRPEPNAEGWVGWPNNCVHGIQLAAGPCKGRLVMPAFLYKEGEPGQVPGVRGGFLYSDDHGQNWKVGAVLPEGSDEVSLVETAGGDIYVSYRKNTLATGKRHFARSDRLWRNLL